MTRGLRRTPGPGTGPPKGAPRGRTAARGRRGERRRGCSRGRCGQRTARPDSTRHSPTPAPPPVAAASLPTVPAAGTEAPAVAGWPIATAKTGVTRGRRLPLAIGHSADRRELMRHALGHRPLAPLLPSASGHGQFRLTASRGWLMSRCADGRPGGERCNLASRDAVPPPERAPGLGARAGRPRRRPVPPSAATPRCWRPSWRPYYRAPHSRRRTRGGRAGPW